MDEVPSRKKTIKLAILVSDLSSIREERRTQPSLTIADSISAPPQDRDPQLCGRPFLPILPFQDEGVLVIQGQRVAP